MTHSNIAKLIGCNVQIQSVVTSEIFWHYNMISQSFQNHNHKPKNLLRRASKQSVRCHTNQACKTTCMAIQ